MSDVAQKTVPDKQAENERYKMALIVAFAYKEKGGSETGCIGEHNCVSRRKNVIEWVKLGFKSGNATIKKEAQLLATNIMKSKRKAYKNASLVDVNHFSDSESE